MIGLSRRLPTFSERTSRSAAVVAAIGFAIVACFQLLLALGVPWGKAAWGGSESKLSTELRVASSVSMLVFIGAALIVLGRGGYWGARYAGVFRIGTWILFAAMSLGVILNLASQSTLERAIWSPVTLVLAVLSFMVARGPIMRA